MQINNLEKTNLSGIEKTYNIRQQQTCDSTWVLEAEPGKLDIKRCEPGILFISLQVGTLFKLVVDGHPMITIAHLETIAQVG